MEVETQKNITNKFKNVFIIYLFCSSVNFLIELRFFFSLFLFHTHARTRTHAHTHYLPHPRNLIQQQARPTWQKTMDEIVHPQDNRFAGKRADNLTQLPAD